MERNYTLGFGKRICSPISYHNGWVTTLPLPPQISEPHGMHAGKSGMMPRGLLLLEISSAVWQPVDWYLRRGAFCRSTRDSSSPTFRILSPPPLPLHFIAMGRVFFFHTWLFFFLIACFHLWDPFFGPKEWNASGFSRAFRCKKKVRLHSRSYLRRKF